MQDITTSPCCYDLRRDFDDLQSVSCCDADPIEWILDNLSNMSDDPKDQGQATRPSNTPVAQQPLYDALHLTDGGNQATIALDDKHYTLRITKSGKLILTK